MSTQPASISLLLDVSGSMSAKSTDDFHSNLQLLLTNTNYFMTIMQGTSKANQQFGQIGLLSFSTEAEVIFPLATLDKSGEVIGKAMRKINSLQPMYNTNIKAAIDQGHAMLSSANAENNRAMILFSDGMYNEGGDPRTPPTDIPIYTIGYGTSTDLSYLKTIAQKTKGQYHLTGKAGIFSTFYNDIIQVSKIADVVANATMNVEPYGLFQTMAHVPQGEAWHLFTATWVNPHLAYALGTPGPGQIQVLLKGPNGQEVIPDVVDSPMGSGYAILTVKNPAPGTWEMTTRPSNFSGGNTLDIAHGIFTANSSIDMQLNGYETNSPMRLAVKLSEEGNALHHMTIQSHAKRPKYSGEELLDNHYEALHQIFQENDFHDDMPLEEAALRILNKQKPELQIFEHHHQEGQLIAQQNGEYIIEIENCKKGVPHTVYVQFAGISPVSGRSIQRTKLITIIP